MDACTCVRAKIYSFYEHEYDTPISTPQGEARCRLNAPAGLVRPVAPDRWADGKYTGWGICFSTPHPDCHVSRDNYLCPAMNLSMRSIIEGFAISSGVIPAMSSSVSSFS